MHIATVKSPDWDKTMDEMNGIVYWTNGTTNNMYSFNNFNRRGPLTKNFMKFVESCEKYGKPATKRSFYKIMNRELLPGNNNTFFMAIKTAGIVTATKEWNGIFTECTYTKGPNWDAYLKEGLWKVNKFTLGGF